MTRVARRPNCYGVERRLSYHSGLTVVLASCDGRTRDPVQYDGRGVFGVWHGRGPAPGARRYEWERD